MSAIYNERKPYTVRYKDFQTNEIKTITRRPPQKLHTLLPEDVVQLSEAKNQDWPQGAEAKISHISVRAPNTLKLKKENQETTFVSYRDVIGVETAKDLKEGLGSQREGYLIWP